MTAVKVFNFCRAKQILLSSEDGKLRVKDLNGIRLEEELLQNLTKWKNDLLILLEKEASDSFSKPYIDYDRSAPELRISFNSHPRYFYWADGQDLEATLSELNAPEKMFVRYVHHYKPAYNLKSKN